MNSYWQEKLKKFASDKLAIAGLAMVVLEAAEAGDEKAVEILRQNAQRLAELLKTGVQRYDVPPQAVAAGSFWRADMFREMVQEMSGVELVVPELPPIYGACVEAMRLAQIPIPQNFYENFAVTYRRSVC